MKASLFFFGYSVLYTVNFVSASFLYRLNPGLGSFQLLYARSIVAIFSIVVWLKQDLKRITYDEVKGKHDNALIFMAI